MRSCQVTSRAKRFFLPAARHATGAWTGTQLIVWGGIIPGELKNTPFSDGAAYQPA